MEIGIGTISELIKNGKLSKNIILKICDDLYGLTDSACKGDYPRHRSWFYQKHLPAVLTPDSGRDIIYAVKSETGEYIGTAFTKKDREERKICTLFVDEKMRSQGVGPKPFEKCFDILETTKPMATLTDHRLSIFEGIIKNYGWEQKQDVKGFYNDKHSELVYNGQLKLDE